jgi:hypothetical protein
MSNVMRAATGGGVMSVIGRITVAVASALFLLGAIVVVTGSDLGILALIVGLGLFTAGVGLMAAARNLR